ncbi:MAG: PH domain-containing protein, partial [Candidatus Bathyarchaeota archaeon]|nr:PH domain-containing protein [Candidatus Bathyarchaeota archaeon]
FELLKDERIDSYLKPHPFSFLKYYLASAYLIFLALALHFLYMKIHELMELNAGFAGFLNLLFSFIPGIDAENLFFLIVFWATLVLSGLLIGVLWVSKAPPIYMVLIALTGTLIELYSPLPQYLAFIPKATIKIWLLYVFAVVGLFLTEIYRRGHKYFLTNYRIITVKKFIGKETREIMYDKIADIYVDQGFLGRIFNYGTIIPISEAGFGLGEDASLAYISATGRRSRISIGLGGKKGVSRPRAATYFSLYGVSNPRKVRAIIVNRQLETKEAPVLRRIEDLLKGREEKDRKDDSQKRI